MPELEPFIQALGPSGVLFALGFYVLRTVLPWVKSYFDAQLDLLRTIAERVERVEVGQQSIAQQLGEVRRDLARIERPRARAHRLNSSPLHKEAAR